MWLDWTFRTKDSTCCCGERLQTPGMIIKVSDVSDTQFDENKICTEET